jgi:putative ABC transport system permease protein
MLGSTPLEIEGELVVMHSSPLEVIGVVKDFYFESAARNIEPLVLTAYSDAIRLIPIRYTEGTEPQELLQSVTETLRTFDPDYVLVNRFATDIYEGYYADEDRVQKILLFGSLLSVLIVLLGIYALVSHNIVARTKEIGIRKVMGGSSREMMTLIYLSTLKWTSLAALFAIPLSWLYLNNWLSDYAVRKPVYWWIFGSSILVVLIVQSLITLGQTWKTARRNPVEALRYE